MGTFCQQFAYLTLLAFTVELAGAGTILTADTKPLQCVVTIDNLQVIKDVGSVWQTNNSCVHHSCEQDDDGNPYEKLMEETCVVNCKEEYEYRADASKCCGTCAKTKCLYDAQLYSVGETWHSENDCVILECILHGCEAMISAYEKACPAVPEDCPKSDVYQEDCCTYCRRNSTLLSSVFANGGSVNELPYDNLIQDKKYYSNHPCVRDCKLGEEPLICKYTFVVEWYETLSKACYDCPYNLTDCTRPHCVTGDGVRRSITVVNRMMPGPSIEVCLNDIIVVDVKNQMLGESTTIHWHGLHQVENPYMDGVPHIAQCPIQPHSTFRYKFTASNAGTHFWHSHTGMQRGDGCFGALIIRQPKQSEHHGEAYDFDLPEHKIMLQDWAHQPGVAMFASHHHSIGDNKPPNILINGRGRYYPDIFAKDQGHSQSLSKLNLPVTTDSTTEGYTETTTTLHTMNEAETTTLPADVDLYQPETEGNMKIERSLRSRRSPDLLASVPLERFTVTSGFKYRFRIINAEFLNCPIAISVDKHTLSVISSDGFEVDAVNVTAVVTYAGERFDFVLHADQAIGNYWVRMKGLMDCDARFTSAFQVAVLSYETAEESEPEGVPHYDFNPGGVELNSLNMGPGYSEFLTVDQLRSVESAQTDTELVKENADYKFFVYYDFYPKDNPDFHPANLYDFNQMTSISNKLLTPQLNHITMKMPSTPLMPGKDKIDDSAFCNETFFQEQGIDCRKQFCKCHHILQVPLNSIVELILVDEGVAYDANHPLHLHGNAFRVIGLDRIGRNVTIEMIREMDKQGLLHRNFDRPPIKDTVTVPDGGYTIVRFRANNPGYWLLHCHIEFHAEIGMALVIKVGEHHEMVPVPKNFPQCSDYIPGLDEETEIDLEQEDVQRGNSVIHRLTSFLLLGVVLSLTNLILNNK